MRELPPPPPLPRPSCSSPSRLAAVSSPFSSSSHTNHDDETKKESPNEHTARELAAADEARRDRQPVSTSVQPPTSVPGAYHVRPSHHSNREERDTSQVIEDITGRSAGDTGGWENEQVEDDEEQHLVVDATVVSSGGTFVSEERGGGYVRYVGTDNLSARAEYPTVFATATKDTFCGYLERTPRSLWCLAGAVLLIFTVLLIGLGASLSSSRHPPPERTDKVEYENDFWVNLQVPPNIDGPVERGEFGATVSMNRDGTRMAVGSPDVMEDDGKGDGLVRRGVVAVYDLTDAGRWEQVGQEIQISARDAASQVFTTPYEVKNELALALSRNGNMLAVGSPVHDAPRQRARPTQRSSPRRGRRTPGMRGARSAVRGSGFRSSKADIGQVEVFSLNGETWEAAGDPLNGDEQEGDFFGASVSLSEDGGILAVGAPGSDIGEGQDSGAVEVYLFNGCTWDRLGEQGIFGTTPNQLLGGSVSLSSDGFSVAVGSSKTSNNEITRVARVYRFQGGDWIEVGSGVDGGVGLFDTAYDVAMSADGDRFVISNHYVMKQTEDDPDVGTEDNIFIMKRTEDDPDIGTEDNIDLFVRAFQLESGDWIPLGDNVHARSPGEKSGYFISLSDDGNVIVMGDPGRRVKGGRNAGHSHIYRFDEETGNYEQVGPDNDGEGAGDLSGFDVSISGDGNRFAVGSPANRGNGFEHGRVQVYMVPDLR